MTPRVSVVIPTWERPGLLRRCLHALSRQTLAAGAFEIIVVHDGHGPESRRVVAAWAERLAQGAGQSGPGPSIRFIEQAHAGPAAARNVGWRAAAGAMVAFTDDDTMPEPAWLEEGLAAFGDGVDAAWGRLEMPVSAVPTDYERDASRLATAAFVTANCFCRKTALAMVGGFDERFHRAWREDSDLYFRLLAAGAVIVHAPRALVVHPVRPARWGVSLAQQKKMVFDALLFREHPVLYRRYIRRHPRWDYYAIVVSLLAAALALAGGHWIIGGFGAIVWAVLTLRLLRLRLAGTVRNRRHVTEMAVTSALIPPLAVFWRLVGAVRYRVAFL